MSFSTHITHIKNLCQVLKAKNRLSPVESYLCQMLEHIDIYNLHFEQSVSAESPFYAEFFKTLQTAQDDNYFDLLECLIVFCRERQLQSQIKKEIIQFSEFEESLLTFYEQSHHWHTEDETLLHHWYVVELPKKYGLL